MGSFSKNLYVTVASKKESHTLDIRSLWSYHARYISPDIVHRIIEYLQNIQAIMRVAARLLAHPLIVIGGSKQARRPGCITFSGIGEVVGITSRVIDDLYTNRIVRICLYGCQQRLMDRPDLKSQALGFIAITVKVACRFSNMLQPISTIGAFMAIHTSRGLRL